ncbi:CBS domain-containing protein [Rhodovibrio salinarum]|uniref:CBS domain-containing protein n=1 Tax=Rhodovibrio salinarum TaxID=1087 RepID=A0A934UYF5_9PROT|nr:CBS domain-containing protein [Rhodovibrio salinarum]MBK1695803.1 CBS domain-containing protein [Rhodovibrio salinarum]
MRIADVPGMHEHRALAVVNDQLTVAEAATLMAAQRIGAVVAVKDGSMSGIFTERDLLVKVAAAGRDATATAVAEVMTTEVATITVDDPVETAVARMRDGGFRHLPVVDASGEPFAMLSLRDLLALVTEAPLSEKAR